VPACMGRQVEVLDERQCPGKDGRLGGAMTTLRPPGVRHRVGFQSEGDGSHKESDKGKGACWVDLHYLGEAIGEAGRSEVLALEYGACQRLARAAEKQRCLGSAMRCW
jgi:hypothetical protein